MLRRREGLGALSWTIEEIVDSAVQYTPRPRIIGVYFLIKDREIIYVGQSVDILSRIDTHRANPSPRSYPWCPSTLPEKDFDSFAFIEIEETDLNVVERFYILVFNPRCNVASYKLKNYRDMLEERFDDDTAHQLIKQIKEKTQQ